MAAWKLTDGLSNLRAQVNARFPGRDHASDGTIGDAAHMAETSSHNPDDTAGAHPEWNGDSDSTAEVRAWDMDSNLRESGATAQQVVDHIRTLPNVTQVLRYMIYNRKIYSASNGWVPQTYSGASAHTEHIHFTGAYTQAADNNTTFDYRLDEIGDDMNVTELDAYLKSADGREALRQPLGEKAYGPESARVSIAGYIAESNLNDDRIPAIITDLAQLSDLVHRIAVKLEVPIPTPDGN